MIKITLFFLCFQCFSLLAQLKTKLMVGVVVDQMKYEYLVKFYDGYGEGGFKRLLEGGFNFKNMHYNYVPTFTGPGHASIFTGTTPAYHGIISNDWYDKFSKQRENCVKDEREKEINQIGTDETKGKSPKKLIASTITDELKLSSNFKSKVLGISIKDRAAILPAGQTPDGAYWLGKKTGHFVSSTYYMDELPEWVREFNRENRANSYLEKTWELLHSPEKYKLCTKDDVPYEVALKGKDQAKFPYDLKKMKKIDDLSLIEYTPYGNSLLVDFSIRAIENEELGKDDYTDFISISFSSTDYVGHNFGPNSVELADTYFRLDLEIKRLLDYLETNFRGEYILFLTSDHGVTNIPDFSEENRLFGGRFEKKELKNSLNKELSDYLSISEDWIENISNSQIFLNHEKISFHKMDASRVLNFLKERLLQQQEIFEVYTSADLMRRNSRFPKFLIENGYNQKRSGDIVYVLKSGYLHSYGDNRGTSHSSYYTYDTHVPLIFYGSRIQKGSTTRKTKITEISPTLSFLLDITLTSVTEGIPLKELIK